MKMDGEIISRENIKPSSPTPHDQKIHKYSLLDQIVPPIFVPFVLYYPNLDTTISCKTNNIDEFISQTTQTLKQSLSPTLSLFYPLAGRIKDTLSVDCNDEGILLVVSKFNENLSDFLKKPDPKACWSHIPNQLTWVEPGPGSHVAMLQVNYFDCGGIAIGSLFLHKVVDGVSIGNFMKAWAAATRGGGLAAEGNPIIPEYTAQSFFPHNESMQREDHLFSAMRKYFKVGKTAMRRYVFDSSAISKLRAQLLSSPESLKRRPSRVEIVSALLWKCFVVASSSKKSISNDDNNKISVSLVTHGVNMRRKSDPPFSEHSFGNFVWLVPASSSSSTTNSGKKSVDDGDLMEELFGKVRNSINKVDVDFVRKMQGGGELGFSGYIENLRETWDEFPEKADYLAISSWCNFGLYGVDFGWGNPVWMTKCDAGSDTEWPFINVLWLVDTSDGDGVEAWLTLDEKYFAAFDEIKELRDIASVDPSPLMSDIHHDQGVIVNNGVDLIIS